MAKQALHFSITATNDDLKRKLAESRQAILNSAKTAEAQASRIDGSFKRMAASAAALGGGIAVGVMAKDLYSFANTFDKSMREVSTISQTVSNDMGGFKQSVLEMTTQIPVGADSAAKALYQIISAGHDGAKGMQVLEVSAKAAIGGVTETATAADAITTMLNAYKKDSAEAEGISDQLFTTVRLGKTTFGELGRSIAQVAPIAASFNIETEQVLAAVATLTKSGTPTAQAMTQIRAAIIGASKELGDGYFKTHTFQEGLAEIANKANGSEAELRKLIPEIEGMNGVLGLTGLNAKTAAEDLAALGNSAGSTQSAFEKMNQGAEAQLTILKNNMLAKFHSIGEGGLNVMGELAKILNTAFETGAIDDLVAIMGVLIATVGVYKAQLLITNAVKLVGNNMEIKAYQALLPVKEASKNKDIETMVAKGQLSVKRAEELIAIRAKVQAQLEELKVQANVLAAEAKGAALAHQNALQRHITAKQNMALAQSQMQIAIQSGNADEIAAAKKAAQTAKLELNSAAIGVNTSRQALNSTQVQANAAATAVDTLQTNINTASTRGATTAKNLFAAATGRLTKAFHAMKAAFASNPIGLLITVATMAISAFSAFGKSVEKITDVTANLNSQFSAETNKIDILFKRLKNAQKGTTEYEKAKKSILDNYGQYLSGLDKEIESLNDVKAAYDAVKKSARESIVERIRSEKVAELSQKAQDGYESAYDKIYEGLKKSFNKNQQTIANTLMPIVRDAIEAENTTVLPDAEAAYNRVSLSLQNIYGKKGASSIFNRISGGLREWLDTASLFNSEITDIEAKLGPISKQMQAADDDNNDNNDKIGEPSKEKNKNYSEQIKKQLQERLRVEKDMELQLAQSKIDAKDEGLDKTLAQNKLNYDKEIEQIKRQREDRLAQIQEWERKEWEAKNPNRAKEGKTFIPTTQVLSASDDSPFVAATAAANSKLLANTKKSCTDQLGVYENFAQSYLNKAAEFESNLKTLAETHEQQRKNLINGGASKEALTQFDAQAKQEIESVTKVQNELLAGMDEHAGIKNEAFVAFVDQMTNMGLIELIAKLDEVEELLSLQNLPVVSQMGGSNEALKAQYQAQIQALKAQIVDLTKKNDTNDVKNVTDPTERWKGTLGIMNDVEQIMSDVIGNFEGLDDTTKIILDSAMNISKGIIKMIINIVTLTTGSAVAMTTTSQVASASIQAVEKASVILAIIGAALQIAMAIADAIIALVNTDHKKEEEIQRLQVEVEKLEGSYEELGEAVEKAYSSDASKLIHQSNEMLEKQNKLIEQQKEAEKSKKDPDNDALDEYDKKIEENNKKIEENKIKAQDAIFGADVKNAIDDFASAYANAWASGEDRAKAMKNVVKNMIKGIIVEMLKSDLAPTVQKIRDEIETMLIDGIIDDYEQSRLDSIIEEATSNADKKYDWADDYLKDDNAIENEKSKVGMITGAGLTEQTAGEFIGIQRGAADKLASINNKISVGIGHIVAIAKSNAAIEANTRATASHTAQTVTTLLSGFSAMQSELVAIKDNTSKDNGSYGG